MSHDIEKTDKKAIESSEETTWAGENYQPAVDIWEDEEKLVLKADVPGARTEDVEIDLNEDVLTINAPVKVADYEGLRPLYSEYNVGNFYRRFSLGETIDQEKISADLADGVLTVTLPKRERAKARKITVA